MADQDEHLRDELFTCRDFQLCLFLTQTSLIIGQLFVRITSQFIFDRDILKNMHNLHMSNA